jgi:phage terminase large subunit
VIHLSAKCCWCQTPLKRDLTGVWWCQQDECRLKQREFAVYSRGMGKYLYVPTPKQVQFFHQAQRTKYTLFGGNKAVAKSYALRWGAYRECMSTPNMKVLLLRRTYGELEQSHLLDMPAEAERLKAAGVDASYLSGSREFRLGSSLVKAGHCETEADVPKFLSSQWDVVIFDEIVTFLNQMFFAIASCARTTKPELVARWGGAKIWAATNPGGRAARWVKEFFIDHEVDKDRFPAYDPNEWAYVPGTVDDNPYMEPGYKQSLMNLPPILRRQWLYSDWDAFEGQFFGEWRAQIDGRPWHVQEFAAEA